MFIPPQTSFGVALIPLPVTWEPNDRPRIGHRAAGRSPDDDFYQGLPTGWTRDTVPDWPAAPPSVTRRRFSAREVYVVVVGFCKAHARGIAVRTRPFRKAPAYRG